MASPDLFCAHCGAANAAMATTCFNCGSSLSQDDPLLIKTGTTSHTSTVSSSPTITITDQLAHDHLLQGHYRILKQIGTGGFGAVYKAQDRQRNDSLVAIKSINLHHLSPEQIIEATDTFNREVGMLSELEHPNLPHIYDHFTDPEHWYLVMDFIEGETLEEYLDSTKGMHLPVAEVLAIGMQLCTVLDYLHTQQPPIIFRDVKPGNIMRTPSGQLYLIDFGIARRFTPGQKRDTTVLGSPGYAAPEQYGKAQTTVQSDIYSLGATLQTLLTGKDPLEPPFGSASPYAEDQEGTEDYRPILDRDIIGGQTFGSASPYPEDQEVPAELELLLVQMLDMDVDKRPACIAIVKQRLLQIKRDQQQQAAHYSAYARSSPPPNTPTISPTSASSSSRPATKQKVFAPLFWSSPSSARLLAAIIVIFLLLCPFLSVALLHTWGGSDTQFPSSSPGSGSGSGSREIIAGPDGALWFTEQDGDKIGRITTQGSITEFALPNDGFVSEITAGPDGAIWFIAGEDKIGRITTQGSITEFALPKDSFISRITAGPDRAIWFIVGEDKIGRITTQGTITEFALPKDSMTSEITAGPDAALWFTEQDGDKIGRITTKGSITEFALPTKDSYPSKITAGPDAAIWFIAGDNKIRRITTKGSITQFALQTQDIADITAGPDRALWFTELESKKIGRITTQGSITEFALPTSECCPLGITTGPDGAIWFIEYGKIGRITTQGTITEFTIPT